MDSPDIHAAFASLRIPPNHTSVGLSNLTSHSADARSLFLHKRLPDAGWSDLAIQRLLFELSCLDTNHADPVSSSSYRDNGRQESDDESDDDDDGSDRRRVKCRPSTGTRTGPPKYSGRWTGAGEREGRVYSHLVSQRHYGFAHGIGRSGDVAEAQPKACGSSALLRLTVRLALDACRRGAGLDGAAKGGHGGAGHAGGAESKKKNGGGGIGGHARNGPASYGTLLPVCTGMSVALVLAGLRERARKLQSDDDNAEEEAKAANTCDAERLETYRRPQRTVVLWSRIDQKSCFKAILSAGLRCVVVPTLTNTLNDEVCTDLAAMEQALDEYGDEVLAVITTTSCFCPRVPDAADEVARMIQARNDTNGGGAGAGVAHVINHAYGLQCRTTSKLLNRACTIGRVDAVICSTDKNFMVPVGGALVISPNEDVVNAVSRVYPGRASASPALDLFVTLLGMGLNGYKDALAGRLRLVRKFRRRFEDVAARHGERMLNCPRNEISFGLTLDRLLVAASDGNGNNPTGDNDANGDPAKMEARNSRITKFGSMLFTRCVSGTRVVARSENKTIGPHTFVGFGSSHDAFPHDYLTAACAIGLGESEMEEFFVRLDKALRDYKKKREKELKRDAKERAEFNEKMENGELVPVRREQNRLLTITAA